jgi:hypothetical protein
MNKSFTCLDCATVIPGTNCAYTLGREKGWRNLPGCYSHCKCGYPVRAKEVRKYILENWTTYKKVTDKNDEQYGFVYCENNQGQGHVYYGNYKTCSIGNGLAASGMSSVAVYEKFVE